MERTLFAGIPVRDRDTSQRWYDALLGSPPAFFPNDREAVWAVGEQRYLYVDVRPEHAGHAMHTLFVEDVGAWLDDIARRGLAPARVEVYEAGTRKAVFLDPDGNEIGIAGPAS